MQRIPEPSDPWYLQELTPAGQFAAGALAGLLLFALFLAGILAG